MHMHTLTHTPHTHTHTYCSFKLSSTSPGAQYSSLVDTCLKWVSQPLHLSSSCQCYYFQVNTHKCTTLSDRRRYKYSEGCKERVSESATLQNTKHKMMLYVFGGGRRRTTIKNRVVGTECVCVCVSLMWDLREACWNQCCLCAACGHSLKL